MVRTNFKKYFQIFSFYKGLLGTKIYWLFIVIIPVGFLDGLGLAMFMPILQSVSDVNAPIDPEVLGNLSFILQGVKELGFILTFKVVLLLMLVFFVFKGVATFYARYIYVKYQQVLIETIRINILDGLGQLKYDYYVSSDAGKIQNALTGEILKVASNFQMYTSLIRYGLLLIIYGVLAFIANPQFALLVVVGGMLSNWVFKILYRKTKEISHKLVSINNIFQGYLIQAVNFFKYLKATASIVEYKENLKGRAKQLRIQETKMGMLGAIIQGAREPIMVGIVVLIIFIQLSISSVQITSIVLALLFFYRGMSYLLTLQVSYNSFLTTSGSLQNIESFMKDISDHEEKTGINKVGKFAVIEFKNVDFKYPSSNKIISNVSLKINANETVAIVGESGAGKTTLTNLMTGILKPTSGELFINDILINEVNINNWRKKIGYITQEPVIFNDTIFNNVTLWDEKNSQTIERFRTVLKMSSSVVFVDDLTLKEDTLLGNNGVNLSGGQRQRISIARELYKKVDVLILDEATSALDSETERSIQDSIDNLKGRLTMIVIAHRLATVRGADRIVVMAKGQVETIGSFNNLREENDAFKRMLKAQFV